jgi:hypothetical protein
MTEQTIERMILEGREIVLGGVEIHAKFARVHGDPGISIEYTPPLGVDGAPEGIEDINERLSGLCRTRIMTMNDRA